MRVLLVMHGRLPRPDQPASGGALRAWNHAEALRAAGHEVLTLTRDQDDPQGFASPAQLRRMAELAQPDRILCVQAEEAPALSELGIPLAVDMYAPRLLEEAYAGGSAGEATRTLRALAAADHLFFSNPRQRWFYQGLLILAGREPGGEVLPLIAPEGPPRKAPREPIFVMGGVAWPWQDPTEGLRDTVARLQRRKRGKILVFGGRPTLGDGAWVDLPARVPAGPRLEYRGPTAWGELLAAYAGATAALDLMAPNVEREIALAFRHVDYLGCGLPLITGGHHALSDAIRAAEAGWVDEPEAVERALADPEEVERRAANARKLAREQFSRAEEAPLLRWVETGAVRPRARSLLAEAAELQAALEVARASAAAEAALRGRAEGEVSEKRQENTILTQQLQALVRSNEGLSRSLEEVAGFKREAVRVLGAEREGAAAEASTLARELADARADLAKKDAEIRALTRERDALQDALSAARDEASYAGRRLVEAGQREDRLRTEHDAERRKGLLDRLRGR